MMDRCPGCSRDVSGELHYCETRYAAQHPLETSKFIEWARELGARRVKVGDVEVEFGPPQPPATIEAPSSPEEVEEQLRRLRYRSST